MSAERELLAYMAGIIDGEGCITISFRDGIKNNPSGKWTPMIQVNMCAESIVRLFHQRYGAVLSTHVRNRQRRVWCWSATNMQAIRPIAELLPFLRLKRRQGEVAIQLQNRKSRGVGTRYMAQAEVDERMRLTNEIRQLNNNGKVRENRRPLPFDKKAKEKPKACMNGHEYTPENTYSFAGKRNCRTCRRLTVRRYYWRLKAKGAA